VKIAFIAKNLSHLRFFQKVSLQLKSNGAAECVVINTVGYKGYDFEYDLSTASPKRGRNHFDNIDSEKYPEVLDSVNISKYIYADREVRHFNRVFFPGKDCNSNAWPMVKSLNSKIGDFFEDFKPDYIVSEFIIGLLDGLFLEHSINNKNCKYINVRQSKMSKGLIFCVDNCDMPRRYIGDREIPSQIVQEALSRADKGIEDTKSCYELPFYMVKTRRNLVPDFGKLSILAERIKYSISLKSFFELEWSLKWYMKKMKNYFSCKGLDWSTLEQVKDKKFFIFPLHYEPEQSVDIRGFPFSQIELVELISKNLPVDCHLVVKEHRGNRGYRAKEDYVRILSLPNVQLIQPEVDNKELLKQSAGILTISGRMGWEAIVQGKPLLVFGDNFYRDVPGICQFIGISSLRGYLENPNSSVAENSDIIEKAKNYEIAVRKGQFVLNSDHFLTEDNATDFIEGLIDFVS